ncbi:ribosome rescue protein RqcH [Halobacteriaceae archaeon SHR40]|uniref:ribosome rescue protein RqcH n=1 Tax=Halovenus amylolytica TaxID=2500550 RepID=UPI000FE2E04C
MERKRELTSVDLAALTSELSTYEGSKLEKAYLYDDGLVRLKMRDFDLGRIELLIDVGETKHLRVAPPEHVPPAPERPPNFAMMLRNRIEGAQLASIEQFEFDRIVSITFERDDGSTTIVAELFGDGNLAVLDETGEVVDCLDTVRLKSRTVAPGSQYEFPDARFNPLTVDYEEFGARLRQSDTDVVRTLATQLNFGGLWGEELCTRAGVEKVLDIEAAGEDQFRAIYEEVQSLTRRLQDRNFDPRVYREPGEDGPGKRVDVTPIPMEEHAELEPDRFESFTDALDDYFTHFDEDEGSPEPADQSRQRPDFEAEIEKQKRIIEQQEGAIDSFEEQADTEREKAELLYAHYDLVDEILTTTRQAREDGRSWDEIEAQFEAGKEQGITAAEAVQSVDESEGTLTVRIDDHDVTLLVSDGVEKNADRLYKEAKRIEGKKEGAKEAIANTREELEAVKERREEWEASDEEASDEQDDDETEEIDWLSRQSVPIRKSESWYEQFRWFETSDGFLVIGGRNADENEEIVKKYLSRGDLFFHTQAHGGPATVLKATGPSEAYDEDIEIPERSKNEAAQFAVSYSSIWKQGKFAADAYMVDHDQVSKTPESGEYLEKGGFAIRGDRTYFEDTPVGVAVGIMCEPETRVIGGPPEPIESQAETTITVEPGKYAQNDIAKRLYREFKNRFADDSFVRKVASPDLIQEFLPPGGSTMVE